MPVIQVAVTRAQWNHVQVKAAMHAVAVYPDLPTGYMTLAQLTGPADKLQAVLNRTVAPLVSVAAFAERDPEPGRS